MILEIDNVELNFDQKRILYGIYLKGEIGKVTGLLGRNGCGKTALLKILFGVLRAKSRTIRIDGIYQKKALFKTGKAMYLPQEQLLPKNIKIIDAFVLFNLNWKDFIVFFNAFGKYDKSTISELSSGEVRVIETYLVLSSQKEIILLDEPFSFLAPIYVEQIKTLIAANKTRSIFIITDHFYRDILEISDSIYLLKDGYSKMVETRQDLKNEGYLLLNSQQR